MEKMEGTILIVDDNPNNLKVVAGVLKGAGFDFRMAKSGQSALKILEKTKPDLILLDIQMPEMDGFETCKIIKQDESISKIPIIYLTANTDSESIQKAFQSGGVDFVTKPFNSDELLARIKTHIKLKKQTEELKKQNATKDKFFSIISHDLINPLGSVIGFSELLKENFRDMDPDKIGAYVGIINKSANFTLDLLKNLLEWSRVQIGSINAVKDDFNISDLVHKNIEGHISQASSKQISFESKVSYNLSVFADEKMVSTIIRNLLSNAIKFTPNGGVITISVEEKVINEKKVIETSITDTGLGISKENIQGLFKVEKNYKSAGTNNEVGTGLGLVLCKEFLDKNDGEIRVESQLNIGSSFIFTLNSSI
tara:strand:- start:16329 stop:17432 length:1104 start_codon:yes stop_codon:yes gene_type:complete